MSDTSITVISHTMTISVLYKTLHTQKNKSNTNSTKTSVKSGPFEE